MAIPQTVTRPPVLRSPGPGGAEVAELAVDQIDETIAAGSSVITVTKSRGCGGDDTNPLLGSSGEPGGALQRGLVVGGIAVAIGGTVRSGTPGVIGQSSPGARCYDAAGMGVGHECPDAGGGLSPAPGALNGWYGGAYGAEIVPYEPPVVSSVGVAPGFDPAPLGSNPLGGRGLRGTETSADHYTADPSIASPTIPPAIPPRLLSISGRVTLSGVGLAGVTVSDGTRTATTGATGYYTIASVPVGTYTVTPTLGGYTMTPTTRSVTLTNVPATGVDFTAAIAYAAGTWIKVGYGTDTVSRSVNGGQTWTGQGSVFSTGGWCVAYASALSLWVIGGRGTDDILWSEDDGLTWTGCGQTFGATGTVRDIAWNASAGYFVAVGTVSGGGATSSIAIAYSSDGKTWTQVSDAAPENTGVYVEPIGVCVWGSNWFAVTLTACDGFDYTPTSMAPPATWDFIQAASAPNMAAGLFKGAVAASGGTVAIVANNGVDTSTGQILKATGTSYSMTKSGVLNVTFSGTYTGAHGGNPHVKIEIDGVGTGPSGEDTFKWKIEPYWEFAAAWEATGVVIDGSAQTLAHGVSVTFAATTGHLLAQAANCEIAIGLSGTSYVGSICTDGGGSPQAIRGVIHDGTEYVAFGRGVTALVATSADLVTWTNHTGSLTMGSMTEVYHLAVDTVGRCVSVGIGGVGSAYSDDFETWAASSGDDMATGGYGVAFRAA